MQNKSAVWLFTILLVLASIFTISFSWVVSGVEDEAAEEAQQKVDSLAAVSQLTPYQRDSARESYVSKILISKGSEEVYPIFGYTYNEAKKREINLGLDLQGGMHVTLEVSVPDMIQSLAGPNRTNPTFVQIISRAKELQRSSDEPFVEIFKKAHSDVNSDFPLSSIFHNLENKDRIAANASNEKIFAVIKQEAEEAIVRTEQVLRKRVDNLGVVQPKIQRLSNSGRIIVELPGVKDKKRVRKILQGTAKLEFWDTYQNYEIYPVLERANNILRATYKKKEEAKEEVKEASSSEEVAQTTQADSIATDTTSTGEESLDDLLGQKTDETELDSTAIASMSDEEKRALNPLFSTMGIPQTPDRPSIGYALGTDTSSINRMLHRKDIYRLFPPRTKLIWGAYPIDDNGMFYNLYAIKVPKGGKARIEGDVITNAKVSADSYGNPTVSMTMNASGTKRWREMTREASANPNDKRSIAVVLDGVVYSAPQVQGEIPSGSTEIAGQFTQQDAADLAGVLKAGKLPAPSHIIEEAVVGPSLGQKSIDSGLMSFIAALVIVLIYMIFYYARAGVVANIALIGNIFFITGLLASFGATLTLPGIAGIVLTIGMSVDANVLIYERVREELARQKGIKQAIQDGYKNAYSSILDANITTLLTAIILAVFGTGPIQGFATTLIMGIFTSLFSAIVLTRLVFEWQLSKKAGITFSTKMTEGAFKNTNIEFIGKRKRYYMISAAIIVLGIGSLFVKGLNYGVDFTGGRSYIVSFDKPVDVTDITKTLGEVFITEDGLKQIPEVKTFGASNQVKITTKYMIENDGNNVDEIIEGKMYDALKGTYEKPISKSAFLEELTSQKVEPTIADDIKVAALWSVLFALAAIFIYILIRFRKLQFSIGAVLAMAHDVLVVLGLFSIFYGILPFSMEIDQAFIAAILTVVGYSINDTVVVFDRIREYLALHPNKGRNEVINSALNSTLSRTVNTSVSTFIVLLIIFIFGGEVIRGFVFALMIGVVVGTYSSLFIAAPSVIDFDKKEDIKAKK